MPPAGFALHVVPNELTAHAEYDFVFKHASGVDINLVVSIPTSKQAQELASKKDGKPVFPVVFFIHGGGAVQGGLGERYQHQLEGMSRVPMVCVAPNYRLCPQTRIWAQLDDVADALKWTIDSLQTELRKKVPDAPEVLTDRILVQGNSEGGFLTLAVTLGACPALHISDPKSHPYLAKIRGANPIYPPVVVSDTIKTEAVVPYPGKNLFTPAEGAELKTYMDPSGPICIDTHFELPNTTKGWNRNMFYVWLCQNGCNTAELCFGPDPADQAVGFEKTNMQAHFHKYESEIKRVVGSAVPAAGPVEFFFVHGDNDHLVTFNGSRDFVPVLREAGFNVKFHVSEGADHTFDNKQDVKLLDVYEWMRSITATHTSS